MGPNRFLNGWLQSSFGCILLIKPTLSYSLSSLIIVWMLCSSIVATFMASLGLLRGVVSIISSACSRMVWFISSFFILVSFKKSRVALRAVVAVVSFISMKRVSSKVSKLVAVLICPFAALVIIFRHSSWYSAFLSMVWMSVVESRK